MGRARAVRALALLGPALLLARAASGEIRFPSLSGRVVDGADLLSAATEASLAERLEAHEGATTNQVVVVTLDSLQGLPIEDFGYQLGRHWGIGQQEKDNGVLLIVAPKERAVRIEVGYGLEGDLTDAISANIIQAIILPRFRRGDFEGGIEAGALAVLEALGGQYQPRRTSVPRRIQSPAQVVFFFALVGLFVLSSLFGGFPRFWRRGWRRELYARGGRFGGGGFGGGFRGGGGGFGGGGASGSW